MIIFSFYFRTLLLKNYFLKYSIADSKITAMYGCCRQSLTLIGIARHHHGQLFIVSEQKSSNRIFIFYNQTFFSSLILIINIYYWGSSGYTSERIQKNNILKKSNQNMAAKMYFNNYGYMMSYGCVLDVYNCNTQDNNLFCYLIIINIIYYIFYYEFGVRFTIIIIIICNDIVYCY